ncbi:MAG: adenylate/guanylate cyclase domain-containing protein, partial [Spirochaetes bacterium]
MKTKHNLLRNILRGSAVGVAAAVLSLILWFSGATEGFEYRLWDFRQRLMAKPGKATEEIVVILLDQNSLDWAKEENGLSWPWPREVYTYIINFVARSNPRALAFDVLYTEPSTYGVYDDESLGRSIKEFKKFVGALFLGETTGNAERWPADITYQEIKIKDIDEYLQRTGREEFEYPRATFPIPEVANNSEYLSNVNLKPDSDGIFRRAKLFTIFDGKVIPSMALALYMTGREESSITVSAKSDKIIIDGYKVPLDSESNAILNFRGPSGSHLTYSAAAVIQSEIQILSGESPRIDPSIFKDKYVLFGFSAPGLLDLRPTPVSSVYAGVEVHATMLDNLLSGDFKKPLNRIHT